MRTVFAQFVVVLLVLLASGNASAANYNGSTEGDAKAVCEQSKANLQAGGKYTAVCEHMPQQGVRAYYCKGTGNGAGYGCDGLVQFHNPKPPSPIYGMHYYKMTCAEAPERRMRVNLSRTSFKPEECVADGCVYKINPTPDDQCYVIEDGPLVPNEHVGYNCFYESLTPTGAMCDPKKPGDDPPPPEPPEKCPEGHVRLPTGNCADRGKCPVGQHMANGTCTPDGACPTGKVKAPDSSCVDETCPAGQVKAQDGTCKKDDDGDGEPNDGEDTGKFSGGEDCKTPPQCSGDNILCGQARIQWRIDCNTRRNDTIAGGGNCTAPPVCSGEKCTAMEYSMLLQQWRTACATESMARNVNGGGSSDVQPGWTKADGMNQNPGAGETAADKNVFRERQVNVDVNTTPIVGGGGTCPGFPVGGGGQGWSAGVLAEIASPPPQWCDMIASLRSVILLFALVIVIYIQIRGG